MPSTLKYLSAVVLFGYFIACAPVKFQAPSDDVKATGDVCPRVCDANGKNCVLRCEVDRTSGTGLVDILIVDDNSGSMSTEQRKMGSRFPDFLNAISNLDYRIAITTTDISSNFSASPGGNGPDYANQQGALQDGNLIEFSPGVKFISNTTTSKESLFASAIQRQETLYCENSRYSVCPSDDERGIYAMNLVLDRTANSFFRPTAHLAVIVLSDEDERGISDQRSVRNSSDQNLLKVYPLESYDRPETFVSKMALNYPSKTYSVHSLIVLPGDQQCLSEQTNQAPFVRGVEGFSYAKLSAISGGTTGTICSNDYGAQLASISQSIKTQISALPFYCRPNGDQYKVTFTPALTTPVRTSADFARMQLVIEDAVPASTKIQLTYDCAITN